MATYPLISYRPDPELITRVDAARARDRRSRQAQIDTYVERGLLADAEPGPATDAKTVHAVYALYEGQLTPREAAAFRKAVSALHRIAVEDAAKEAQS